MSIMNRKLIKALAETMSKKVERFDKTEVEHLVREFYILLDEHVSPGKESHGLDRGKFRGFLHSTFGMTNDMMMNGVFRNFDKDGDGFISLKEWLDGLSVFLRGNFDEHIMHCFSVYDVNGEQSISRDEIFLMLKKSFLRLPTDEDHDEGVKDLVEIAIRRMETDHDGLVSVEEFEDAVLKEDLLMEAFGTCLPTALSIEKFEQRVFQEPLEQ